VSLGRDYLSDPDPPCMGQRIDSRTRWRCSDGTSVAIREMTNNHLVNVIAWLERQPDEVAHIIPDPLGEIEEGDVELVEWARGNYTKSEWLAAFRKELKRRLDRCS